MPFKQERQQSSPESAHQDASNDTDDTTAAESALKQKLGQKKRTKTGCLTCRRRRIKCGEERPICANCRKSRRVCEGSANPAIRFRGDDGPAGMLQFGGVPSVYHYSHAAASVPPVGPSVPYMVPPSMNQQASFYQHTSQWSYGHNSGGLQHMASGSTYVMQQMPQQQSSFIDNTGPAFPTMHTLPQGISHWSGAPMVTSARQPAMPLQPTRSQQAWQNMTPPRNRVQSSLRSSPESDHSGSASMDRIWDEYALAAYLPDSGPTQLLTAAAVQEHDDDYWDVASSDDESNVSLSQTSMNGTLLTTPHQRLAHALHKLTLEDGGARLPPNILDFYRPEQSANILRNPATARIFLHWITRTAPGLQGVFERDPMNTISVFAAGDIPLNRRALFTYALPIASLHDSGLLHAILALASIEIAHIQGGSTTPAHQHYAWSLKRVHASVSNPKKRLRITTIAATLLLAHYEMICAVHSSWNMHMAGAKQLLLELDIAGMVQKFTVIKKERELRRKHQEVFSTLPPSPGKQQDQQLDQIPIIDEAIVSRFIGQEVRYGQLGNVEAEQPRESVVSLDLCEFEMMKDLTYWFKKQDCYLSLVAGTPLLMDWSRWSACPPRAPLGKADAVYGSYDHIILLLGRITRYTAEDRRRKLKVMKHQGGFIPHPSKLASAFPRPAPSPGSAPAPGPSFMGMAPPGPPLRMPASYSSNIDASAKSTVEEEDSIWSIEFALHEYAQIQSALQEFKARLGPDFEPLPSTFATSFGPVLAYRSLEIACVMALYNLCMLMAIRAHPYYHPAATVAALMAASETHPYANDIGRICAGIPLPHPSDTRPLDPYLSSALVESTMPSMFAASQYTLPDQRFETVARIYNIGRRTGWKTADIVANGCESSWVIAGSTGRGPPYERIVEREILDTLKAHSSGRPDIDTIELHSSTQGRLYRACGLLGTEDDV